MKQTGNISILLLLAAWCLSFSTGCDRPFQDVGEATIEVIEPDVTIAQTEPTILLELSVESVREVTRVTSQGTDFSRDQASGHWLAPFTLQKGLNRILVEAFVDDGPTRLDTISVFYLTYSLETPTNPLIAFPTGSHSLTGTPGSKLVLIGGSFQAGEFAALDAHVWSEGNNVFRPMRALPAFPRVGHSASSLPDGRVLIAGGAVGGNPETVGDFVSHPEIFDPVTETFSLVPFKGDPIRRMYHTAVIREVSGNTFLVLLGGRGDTQYVPSPLLGIRKDMRTFLLRNDSLIAISPAVGPFIEPLAGHTQTAVGLENGTSGRFLVNGLRFGTTTESSSFIMDFDGPFGIEMTKTSPMNVPRIRHAGVLVAPGIVALFGGRGQFPEDVYGSGELFVEEANQYFTLPFSIKPRFGLTANRLANNSILLLGGFDTSSNATNDAEFVSLRVE